jgi:hypothetical protein
MRHARFEVSQFLTATGDDGVGGGQECSQLRSSQHVALNLQGQPRELGAISHCGLKLAGTRPRALF